MSKYVVTITSRMPIGTFITPTLEEAPSTTVAILQALSKDVFSDKPILSITVEPYEETN